MDVVREFENMDWWLHPGSCAFRVVGIRKMKKEIQSSRDCFSEINNCIVDGCPGGTSSWHNGYNGWVTDILSVDPILLISKVQLMLNDKSSDLSLSAQIPHYFHPFSRWFRWFRYGLLFVEPGGAVIQPFLIPWKSRDLLIPRWHNIYKNRYSYAVASQLPDHYGKSDAEDDGIVWAVSREECANPIGLSRSLSLGGWAGEVVFPCFSLPSAYGIPSRALYLLTALPWSLESQWSLAGQTERDGTRKQETIPLAPARSSLVLTAMSGSREWRLVFLPLPPPIVSSLIPRLSYHTRITLIKGNQSAVLVCLPHAIWHVLMGFW